MSLRSTAGGRKLKDLAKDVAKPIVGPLDRRLADVVRRVESTRAVIEQREAAVEQALLDGRQGLSAYADSVAHYTRAATETTSYFGVELRRFQDAVDATRECAEIAAEAARAAQAAAEASLNERFDQSTGIPLELLGDSLAGLINHAAGHRGFAAQAGLWFNPPVVAELGTGDAHLSVVNERIIEVPFAMGALCRLAPPARILDVGSTESTFALSAASLGYEVTAVDPRPLGYSHPNLESVRGLVEDLDLPAVDHEFDAVFLISTIEHVGVGAYGQEAYGARVIGGGADRAVIDRVKELLKPNGLLVLTTPMGTRGTDALERTYDEESLDRLMAGFEVLDRRVATRTDELTWVSGMRPGPGERGVAMLLATPRPA